jgi:hypothetical protein
VLSHVQHRLSLVRDPPGREPGGDRLANHFQHRSSDDAKTNGLFRFAHENWFVTRFVPSIENGTREALLRVKSGTRA